MITDITATTAEAEDYTGEDGFYTAAAAIRQKKPIFQQTAQWLGHDRHPTVRLPAGSP